MRHGNEIFRDTYRHVGFVLMCLAVVLLSDIRSADASCGDYLKQAAAAMSHDIVHEMPRRSDGQPDSSGPHCRRSTSHSGVPAGRSSLSLPDEGLLVIPIGIANTGLTFQFEQLAIALIDGAVDQIFRPPRARFALVHC